MSAREPEPRTAVMIMVEASWADQSGTLHKCSATMENTSKSGARIRLRKPIQVGTKLQVQWRWEQFTGSARYCRSEGKEFVVGIQKDPEERAGNKEKARAKAVPAIDVESRAERVAGPIQELVSAAAAEMATPVSRAAERETLREVVLPPRTAVVEQEKMRGRETSIRVQTEGIGKAVEEKKPMRRRWFGLGHTEEDREDSTTRPREREFTNDEAPQLPPRAAEARAEEGRSEGGDGIELLSMPDIYQTAGIRGPRKGYSINKIVELLRSEHLRGLAKEMKRTSILVALDAAGISLDDVVEDANARLEAIDSYETSQRKQFEAHLVRRAEENQQIMAELERVKATYAERLRRNLEGVAREKATFGNWLTLKQQEAANITEALELCTKPVAAEPAKAEIDASLISTKPV